jgi:hypothetical protein
MKVTTDARTIRVKHFCMFWWVGVSEGLVSGVHVVSTHCLSFSRMLLDFPWYFLKLHNFSFLTLKCPTILLLLYYRNILFSYNIRYWLKYFSTFIQSSQSHMLPEILMQQDPQCCLNSDDDDVVVLHVARVWKIIRLPNVARVSHVASVSHIAGVPKFTRVPHVASIPHIARIPQFARVTQIAEVRQVARAPRVAGVHRLSRSTSCPLTSCQSSSHGQSHR